MRNELNPVLLPDSYKVAHHLMMPKDTVNLYAYFEARSNKVFDKTLVFGLNFILNKLARPITLPQIMLMKEFYKKHFGGNDYFNYDMYEYIVQKYRGKLPLMIRAIPEGTLVRTGNALFDVYSLDEKCYPLVTGVETALSQAWYPFTVATISFNIKQKIKSYLQATSDSLDGLEWMLHDFGQRGVSSDESAAIGGAAHLVNFRGTDNTMALMALMEEYGYHQMPGDSVAATEHSIMTCRGLDKEYQVVQEVSETFKNTILSEVLDSSNIYETTKKAVTDPVILGREGLFVIRLDSGKPTMVSREILDIIADKAGYTINSKGYKVINPKFKILWGDGLDIDLIEQTLEEIMNHNYCVSNFATLGMGGGLLQKCNRDTMSFAYKVSARATENELIEVYKDPVHGGKTSKKGLLKTVVDQKNGNFMTVKDSELDTREDCKIIVFEAGYVNSPGFDSIRAAANSNL